jgi:hypothetical protein
LSEQVNGENGEVGETIPACDIIRITGQPDNVAAAKQALLDLVPITIQVSLSFYIKLFLLRKYSYALFFFYILGRCTIRFPSLNNRTERQRCAGINEYI